MNRNHDLGPKTFTIDYPISHLTLITTVLGKQDNMRMAMGNGDLTVDGPCSKFYEKLIIVRQSKAADRSPQAQTDIFHPDLAASLNICDLYNRLIKLPGSRTGIIRLNSFLRA